MRDKLLVLLLVAAGGCGGSTRVIRYARPIEPRLPPVVRLESPSAPFQRDPLSMVDNDVVSQGSKGAAQTKDPHAVIAAGNDDADTVPEDGDAYGNTMVYEYSLDRTFHVYGCLNEDIDVMFADGENIVEAVGKKDERPKRLAAGWKHGFIVAGDDNGHVVEVLVIRPLEQYEGLRKMKVHTNIGPYTFMLEVLPPNERRCMDKVRFTHPARELARALAADDRAGGEKATGVLESIGCNSNRYDVAIVKGSPRWAPGPGDVWRTCVGEHAVITIQFPRDVAWSAIPAFRCDNGACIWKYLPEEHAMTIQDRFTRGRLVLGTDETGYEIVEIRELE